MVSAGTGIDSRTSPEVAEYAHERSLEQAAIVQILQKTTARGVEFRQQDFLQLVEIAWLLYLNH